MTDKYYRDRLVPNRVYKTNGKNINEDDFYSEAIYNYDGDIESLPWHDDKGCPWEKDYKQNRIEEYGSTETQLEFLVENGVDAFIARQNEIKNKYPKENE